MSSESIVYSDNLIDDIIRNDPKEPRSLLFQFINNISVMELFMFCMEFFLKISKEKYSNENNVIDISEWTLDIINEINEYYNSFCIKINIIILESTEQNINELQIYENKRYDKIVINNNTKLSELYYILHYNKNNTNYIINFDFL
jgi:hypothetical protein